MIFDRGYVSPGSVCVAILYDHGAFSCNALFKPLLYFAMLVPYSVHLIVFSNSGHGNCSHLFREFSSLMMGKVVMGYR